MAYNVVLRRNGAKVGHFGPFTTKKQAIAQGQALADDAARDVVVSVEPQRKKATTKRKRTNTRRKRKNGPTLGKPHYPFAEKEKLYATFTDARLYSAMQDAMATSRAQQDWNPTGANWYLDDYHTIVKEIQKRKRAKKRNPGRGTFKSKTYAYYTVANGKLTSGHGSPTGTPSAKRKARAEAKKRASRPENVMTAKQAQKYVDRSLTSSAAWYNEPRRNPRTRKNSYHVSPNEDPHSFNKPILKKLRSMKSNPASKSILKRIALANKWIEFAKKHDIWGIDPYMNTSFNGVINYTHKITVSAQKNRATFKYTDGYPKLGKKESETYNLNNTDTYSDTGVSALRYAINSLIIKPIKRGAKDEGITIPASLR